eukprot:m.17526 g.17526  ORF g.17526 m.17526 type:complete len:88 (+) comp8152_c0_seq1:139-402(+)
MPYVVISVENELLGPTCCGDAENDEELMEYIEAKLVLQTGHVTEYYLSQLSPRQVLNKLEEKGYQVVASAGMGQTCSWTLYKPLAAE